LGGRLFGQFFNISEIAQFWGATVFHRASYVFILTRRGLGYILGDFKKKTNLVTLL
jgi:hypothetical protein